MAIKFSAKKTVVKAVPSLIMIKKRESILLKEIMFLEKNISNYKAERKASWKAFKTKTEIDLNIIKQSIESLTQSTQEN